MPWFRIDDSFYDHPKIFDAPDCAVALWTRAGTWSARNLTDGFVPSGMPARLCGDPDTAVKELTRRGLWKRTNGGFLFHDWSDFQPTAREVRETREKRAAAGRIGGRASGKARSTRATNLEAHAEALASPTVEPPARPDPAPQGGPSTSATHDRAHDAPPPRCPQHLDDPDPPPCGPCGDARRARTRWELANAERQRKAPRCRTHRGQPAHNCALCRSERLAAEDREAS